MASEPGRNRHPGKTNVVTRGDRLKDVFFIEYGDVPFLCYVLLEVHQMNWFLDMP